MILKTAKLSTSVSKRVLCEKCGEHYLYTMTRVATGTGIIALVLLLGCVLLLPVILLLFGPAFLLVLPLGGGFLAFLRMRSGPVSASAVGSAVLTGLKAGEEEASRAATGKLRRRLEDGAEPVPCPACGWYQRDMISEVRSRSAQWMIWAAIAAFTVGQVAPYLWIYHRHLEDQDARLRIFLGCTAAGIGTAMLLFAIRWLASKTIQLNAGYPSVRPPVPGAPPAIRQMDHVADVATRTARLTAAQTRSAPRGRTWPPRQAQS